MALPLSLLTLRQFPVRTVYCLMLLGLAFMCYCTLRSLSLAYSGAQSADPIVTVQAHGNFMLPVSLLEELTSFPKVGDVTPTVWFGAYRQGLGPVTALGVDPHGYAAVFGIEMDEGTRECFSNIRTALITTTTLAEIDRLVIGETIPVLSNVHYNKDGSMTWPFHFCGTFTWPKADTQPKQMLFNYEYLMEYGAIELGISGIAVRTTENAASVAQALDAHYANSAFPTISRPRDELRRGYIRRIGDIGLVVGVLALSIFASTLFVSHMLYVQSLRERESDLATLHAIGLPLQRIILLPLVESLALAMAGCLLGIVLAALAVPLLGSALQPHLGSFRFFISHYHRVGINSRLFVFGFGDSSAVPDMAYHF